MLGSILGVEVQWQTRWEKSMWLEIKEWLIEGIREEFSTVRKFTLKLEQRERIGQVKICGEHGP